MTVDGANCPDDGNSTDCLLRSLLHLLKDQRAADDAETNWDPITFYATLPISILATVFAVTTIYQGILTAGTGRRRTDRRAIGRWHQGTEKNWNWRSFSYEHRAWVPIMRENTLQSFLFRKGRERLVDLPRARLEGGVWANAVHWLRLKGHSFHEKLLGRYHDSAAATWVAFFDHVGLGEVCLPGAKQGLQPVAAGYLPDDLVAVPAYGQVKIIVAAAAAAGARIKHTDDSSPYPVLIGRNFQFDFRQHPVLGMVGAYSCYTRKRPRALGRWEIKTVLRYSYGMVDIQEGIFRANIFGERFDEPINLLNDSGHFTIKEALSAPCIHKEGTIPKLMDVAQDFVPLAILFLAETPTSFFPIFPTAAFETKLPLTTIALSGRFWANLTFDAWSRRKVSRWPLNFLGPEWKGFAWGTRPWPSPEDLDIDECEAELEQVEGDMESSAGASDDYPTTFTTNNSKYFKMGLFAFHMCIKLLHDQERFLRWFRSNSGHWQSEMRSMLYGEIKTVDEWLEMRHGSKYRIGLLCNTTMILLRAASAPINESFESLNAIAKPDSTPESHFNHLQEQQRETNIDLPGEDSVQRRHAKTMKWLSLLLERFGFRLKDITDGGTVHHEKFASMKATVIKCIEDDIAKNAYHLACLLGPADFPGSRGGDPLNIYLMLERLAVVVARGICTEDPEYSDEAADLQSGREEEDIDDVIVFRCLMMALLFRTAQDSSRMLDSGVWDQVIPIL